MKLPRITVVTPSYNQARFLEKTIQSILNQGYPNLEYIIMDGGSTDGSREIIEQYSDQLAYWVSEPDQGQSDAIRRGFERSTGDILCWVNSDDLLLPGSLDHVARIFTTYPGIDFLAGGHCNIDPDDHVTWCLWPIKPTLERLLLVGFYVGQPACFYTRSAYERAGGMDASFQFTMDHDLFLRILDKGKAIATNQLLACFRMHGESKSSRLEHIHQKEKSRLDKQWNRESAYQQNGSNVIRTWKLLTKANNAIQQIYLFLRFGSRRPWLKRKMSPEELIFLP